MTRGAAWAWTVAACAQPKMLQNPNRFGGGGEAPAARERRVP